MNALRLTAPLSILLLLLSGCGDSADAPSAERDERPGAAAESRGSSGGGPPAAARQGGGRPGGAGGGRLAGGRPGGSGGPPVGGPPGGFGGFGGGAAEDRGVPVEVAPVVRRSIASYLETHGTLEAENEVDLVARTAGPIVELAAEEGMTVRKGQVLARIDDREVRAQLEVSKVRLEETQLAYERAKQLHSSELVSQETLDQALANYQSAQGDTERLKVQMEYTEISAPFSGLIVQRYVKFAQHLANGAQLFRLSDFDPLLAPIQVPERELPRLRVGQAARIEVEAWGDESFRAKVLRLSPVVDAATGTIRVTLEVQGRGKLRPGMFASVYLEMARKADALVVPKSALALDSLGDTVFVADGETAVRRAVELGFQNDNLLEVRGGLGEGEQVIVVGQDGLSEGTPIEILRTVEVGGEAADPDGSLAANEASGADPAPRAARRQQRSGGGEAALAAGAASREGGAAMRGRGQGAGSGRVPGGGPGGGPPGRGFLRNLDLDDPEQVERVKGFMRQRGLTEAEIEQRLEQIRARRGGG
ncbi:MAG: efflux RND transporter periplasmic adaptor subunit [Acidobacteriota bacterium]